MAKLTNDEIIKIIRDHASKDENYCKGWDVVDESWDDSDIVEAVGNVRTSEGAIRKLWPIIRQIKAYADDIRNA